MKIKFIILSAFLPLLIAAQSLEETVQIALQNNTTLKAITEEINKTESQAKSADRHTLPTIDFSAKYHHITHVAELDFASKLPPVPGLVMPAEQLGTYDNYELGITANYVLFAGFAQTNNVRLHAELHNLSTNELEKSKKEIVFQAITAYRQAQNFNLEIASLDSAKERVQLQLDKVLLLKEQGMALELDTLTLALAKLRYKQQIIATVSKLKTGEERLEYLTGRQISVEQASEEAAIQSLAELDYSSNENIIALDYKRNILEFSKKIEQSNYYPKVGLFASFKYGQPGADIIQKEWIPYGIWGAGIQWNIFSWGADRSSVEAKEASIRQLEYRKLDLVNRIRAEYNAQVGEYKALREQLQVLKTTLNVARHKLRITEIRYNEGMASATDYNDANLDRALAEINFKRHILRMDVKIREIDFISGKKLSQWSVLQ